MATFKNNNDALNEVKKLHINSFMNNDGIEVRFESSENYLVASVLNSLKNTFSNVCIKGRKCKSIIIKRLSQEVIDLKIIKVEY